LPSRAYRRLLGQIFGVPERELGFPSVNVGGGSISVEGEQLHRRDLLIGATAVGASALFDPPPQMASGPATSPMAHDLRAYLARAALDSASMAAPTPLESLHKATNRVWSLFQTSSYTELAHALPDLLSALKQTADNSTGAGRAIAHALLAEAYQVMTYALTKLGDPQAAWLASERGLAAAREGSDDLVYGHSVAVMSYALRESGHPAEAETLCLSAAESLNQRLDPAIPAGSAFMDFSC
jgi:hypothetical protein